MAVTDILLEENGDVRERDGDFVIGDADQQHQALLLMMAPGESTQHPVDGVGLTDYLEDDEYPDKLKARIVAQFEADGQTGVRIAGDSFDNLKIDGVYNG